MLRQFEISEEEGFWALFNLCEKKRKRTFDCLAKESSVKDDVAPTPVGETATSSNRKTASTDPAELRVESVNSILLQTIALHLLTGALKEVSFSFSRFVILCVI